MTKPKTPMSDLYLWDVSQIGFAAGYGGEVYHGYRYTADRHRSFCHREVTTNLRGSVTAWFERDISPVRRPCERCLAALRKAKKKAESQ